MEDKKQLIESVLKKDPQDIAFEPIPEETSSPLAQPVVQKNNISQDVNASKNEAEDTGNKEDRNAKPKDKPTDAPEQEVDADPTEEDEKENTSFSEEEKYSMPLEHAGLLADSIIGTINNTVLEIGGGYFVTIRKHKDFYDFEEVIQVIDEQNVKNIKRLKLDEEDKALLRPLLIHILRKKAEVLSPEKQFVMVLLSILMKKTKAVIEIRAENELIVERIRDIIRKEVRAYRDEQQEKEKEEEETDEYETAPKTKAEKGNEEVVEVVYETTPKATNRTGVPESALETFE